jgi:hypothetical protein
VILIVQGRAYARQKLPTIYHIDQNLYNGYIGETNVTANNEKLKKSILIAGGLFVIPYSMKIKKNVDLLLSFIINNYKKYPPSFPPKYKPLKKTKPVNANDYKIKIPKVKKTDLSLYNIKKQPINIKKNNNVLSKATIDKKLDIAPKIPSKPLPSPPVQLKKIQKTITLQKNNSTISKFNPFYRSTNINKPQQKSKIMNKQRLTTMKRTIKFSIGIF